MTANLERTVIAIDGLAASGKSTLAKLLAKELGFLHVNTGLLYRAAALLAIESKLSTENTVAIVALLNKHNLSFNYSLEQGSRLSIDGDDRSDQLQSQEVASFTSKIAAVPAIRESLRNLQAQAFPHKDIVAEGRDTGTVIFPNASVKFFVVGDPHIRATRRALDLRGKLTESELKKMTNTVAEDLRERDERDSMREVAPLKPALDAIVIDNSVGDLTETVRSMAELVRKKGLN